MTKTLATLKDILTPLCKSRRSIWPTEDWERVLAHWRPISREELEGLFTQPKIISGSVEVNFSQSERGQVLYLPPLEKNPRCVPILSLYCKLNDRQSIARFRVMLVRLDKKGKPYGIGFRLETPHSQDQDVDTASEGMHDFHHAQLIRRFRQEDLDSELQIDCPIWLPDSQPSFPLPANCPVTLLLCLIVTLYGRDCYNRFLLKHRIFDISRYQKKLDRWINWKPN